MRQFLTILLALIYLVLSAGLQLTTHYCHDKLESVKVLVDKDLCCCGDNEMQSKCCSDEILSFKADIDFHLTTENRLDIEQDQILANFLISFNGSKLEAEESKIDNRDFESPPILKQPLWLLNSTFTFYG